MPSLSNDCGNSVRVYLLAYLGKLLSHYLHGEANNVLTTNSQQLLSLGTQHEEEVSTCIPGSQLGAKYKYMLLLIQCTCIGVIMLILVPWEKNHKYAPPHTYELPSLVLDARHLKWPCLLHG